MKHLTHKIIFETNAKYISLKDSTYLEVSRDIGTLFRDRQGSWVRRKPVRLVPP